MTLDMEFGLSELHKSKNNLSYVKTTQHRKDKAESKFDIAQPICDDLQEKKKKGFQLNTLKVANFKKVG